MEFMTTTAAVREVLATIPDPEMPISIVDLGLIEDVRITGPAVAIDVLPTFVGCPALDMIRNDIIEKVSVLDGVEIVAVNFLYDPPWTVDRITDVGRAELGRHGVTVPDRGTRLHAEPGDGTVPLRTSAVPCPFCGSTATRLDSAFGPTRCRMIYYCEACRNGFEHMKRVGQTSVEARSSS